MNTKPTTQPQVHPSLLPAPTQVGALAQALFCAITVEEYSQSLAYADLAEKLMVGLSTTQIKQAKATVKRAAKVCRAFRNDTLGSN